MYDLIPMVDDFLDAIWGCDGYDAWYNEHYGKSIAEVSGDDKKFQGKNLE